MAERGALVQTSKSSPLRHHKRVSRSLDRLHPYKREQATYDSYQRNTLRTNAASSNGNGNATLSADRLSENGQPALFRILQQVAEGSLDPIKAATQAQTLVHAPPTPPQTSESEAGDWGEQHLPAEMVWAPGKSVTQIAYALQKIAHSGLPALAVRVSPEIASELASIMPEVKQNEAARILTVSPSGPNKQQRLPGSVAIISDQTAEDHVVQECLASIMAQGCYAYKLGSAGNSLPNLSAADSASVVIVVGDCQANLPGMIANAISPPVIFVPTNESASRSPPGLTSVDANNGLAAAIVAARILRTAARMYNPKA